MRPFIWEQPSGTVPGVPMAPFRLGAPGHAVSLSPLAWRVVVGVDAGQIQLQHGQGKRPPESGSADRSSAVTPCPSGCPLLGSQHPAQSPGRTQHPALPLAIAGAAWGPHGSRRSQGHLLSPGAGSGETKGGSGRAALFPCCRELLYKGSGDIIH